MKKNICIMLASLSLLSCAPTAEKEQAEFDYTVERFADLEILRYEVAGFDELTLDQKKLIYYLQEAALQGRDILFDQNGKWNLAIRQTLETVYTDYQGDRTTEEWADFETYTKQVWFANGIHHHYSSDKFLPTFFPEYFAEAVKSVDASKLPIREGETVEDLIATLTPIMFDPTVMPKRTNQADGEDLILTSAGNYYDGVTQQEAEAFYNAMKDPKDETPISYGLNSRLVKRDGKIYEEVYKIDGRYGSAIARIVEWLEKAAGVAENDAQKAVIEKLIEYYRTGDLRTFDEYAILWVQDLDSRIDFVNGFTESYGDPIGLKASWESIVNFKDLEASRRTQLISENAQWFEENSPTDKRFKKENVKGVAAKVITAAILAGDCYPSTPIGINLPNANWIRATHGSKSVTIDNLTEAYAEAAKGNGFNEEFVYSDVERELLANYGGITGDLHTDLHECLGHGSGKLLPGVDPDALRSHGSTLEEARADLFALYYMADAKLVELGIIPNDEAYKACYYQQMMNGLMTQLHRIEPGKDIEESHMRDRQPIAAWAYDLGKAENVMEIAVVDGKRYVKINDYVKLREIFGQQLAEIQRIKSEGDYEAGRILVEKYAVKVDADLHNEVLARYEALNLAPYKGFVNPVYVAEYDAEGNITDVKLDYTEGYAEQMLRYSSEYGTLPAYND
ncbi:MAG: dihydrofolate reductase [Bacteroidaceae bacterium]|nr:dihydrofolate reductase [Bacteroidaceae bacterium]